MQPIDLNDINDYPKFYFGGFWRRAGAGFIDSIIMLIVFFITSSILKVLISPHYFIENLHHVILYTPILWGIASAIYSIAFIKFKGATPGKMISKLKVVKIDQSSITWMDAFLRYSLYLVLFILILTIQTPTNSLIALTINIINMVWAIASIICLVCHRQRRTLHDLIAKTAVVKV